MSHHHVCHLDYMWPSKILFKKKNHNYRKTVQKDKREGNTPRWFKRAPVFRRLLLKLSSSISTWKISLFKLSPDIEEKIHLPLYPPYAKPFLLPEERGIANQIDKAQNIHVATLKSMRIHCTFKALKAHTDSPLACFLLGAGGVNTWNCHSDRVVLPGLGELVMTSRYCDLWLPRGW